MQGEQENDGLLDQGNQLKKLITLKKVAVGVTMMFLVAAVLVATAARQQVYHIHSMGPS